jgi:hypothetical protein
MRWFREAAGNRCRLRATALGALAAAPLLIGACGEDDFPNDPRPAAPIELTAAIDERSVIVSPTSFGAGLVNLTVSNQTNEPASLMLDGPTSETTNEIPPGGTGSLKANLEEGEYEAKAGSEVEIRPAQITVGPERPTSQNELLQP